MKLAMQMRFVKYFTKSEHPQTNDDTRLNTLLEAEHNPLLSSR
jgi:hypothetical protein